MTKLNIFLALILIVCALGVVTSQHEARKLFVVLENEREMAHQLEVEWGKLQLEQSTLAMHGRVESIASGQLNMKVPTQSRVQVVIPELVIDSAAYEDGFQP